MSTTSTLQPSDRDLLLRAIACLIAADRRVSGREVETAALTLSGLGCDVSAQDLKRVLVPLCQEAVRRGVDVSATEVACDLSRVRNPDLQKMVDKSVSALLADSQGGSDEERRVAQILLTRSSGRTASKPEDLCATEGSGKRGARPTRPAVSAWATWKLAIAIVLLYPYGVYLLWKRPVQRGNKLLWGLVCVYPFIVGALGSIEGSGDGVRLLTIGNGRTIDLTAHRQKAWQALEPLASEVAAAGKGRSRADELKLTEAREEAIEAFKLTEEERQRVLRITFKECLTAEHQAAMRAPVRVINGMLSRTACVLQKGIMLEATGEIINAQAHFITPEKTKTGVILFRKAYPAEEFKYVEQYERIHPEQKWLQELFTFDETGKMVSYNLSLMVPGENPLPQVDWVSGQ